MSHIFVASHVFFSGSDSQWFDSLDHLDVSWRLLGRRSLLLVVAVAGGSCHCHMGLRMDPLPIESIYVFFTYLDLPVWVPNGSVTMGVNYTCFLGFKDGTPTKGRSW